MLSSKQQQKCKTCNGKGKVTTKQGIERRCAACRGSGKAASYQTKG